MSSLAMLMVCLIFCKSNSLLAMSAFHCSWTLFATVNRQLTFDSLTKFTFIYASSRLSVDWEHFVVLQFKVLPRLKSNRHENNDNFFKINRSLYVLHSSEAESKIVCFFAWSRPVFSFLVFLGTFLLSFLKQFALKVS